MAGFIPGTSLNGATITRFQSLRRFPQFLAITELNRSEGESRYDGGQLLLSKRLSQGITASLSYTYSRTIERVSYRNGQQTQPEKLVADWDTPQSLQLHGVYELPFGQGRHFLAGSPRPIRYLMGGWELSGIARLQSGLPMTMNVNTVPTGVSPKLDSPDLTRWFNTCTQLASGALQNCKSGETPVWTVRPNSNVLHV